jgi:CMP-N-acetylneuraminic acid synthetase
MPTSNEAAARHLAVIPARGGSKRLPRKNVIDFFGRPILAHTIAAARAAGIFERILVSTEDAEILRLAQEYRAEVDARPAALGRDEATVTDVCLELLGRHAAQGDSYNTLTVLYATAPLRSAEDIRATHALLEPGHCDFAMAVTEFQQPVHQALKSDADGRLTPVFPDVASRRADVANRFVAGNGSTYSVNVSAFLRVRDFYGQPLCGHIMPLERSVDIDTAADLDLARYYGNQLGLHHVPD